jgi:hypothetical protein
MMQLIGSPSTRAWDAAIVIQGPFIQGKTNKVIEGFKKNNKNCLLIIASYYFDTTHISPYEDSLIALGEMVILLVPFPPSTNTEFWKTNHWNQNLQRLTSHTGLKYAHSLGIEYALKVRSDMFFEKENSIDYLKSTLTEFPTLPYVFSFGTPHSSTMRARIAVSGHGTFNPTPSNPYPFHVCDFWLFGFTTDLISYFDVDTKLPMLFAPESNLCIAWMSRMGINAIDTLDLATRYLVIIDPLFLEPAWQHPKSNGGYAMEIYQERITRHSAWRILVEAAQSSPRVISAPNM